MARTDLLDKVVATLVDSGMVEDRYWVLMNICGEHDRNCGLYDYAKMHNVLENGSAEEFTIQFYTAFNTEVAHRY